MPDDPFLQKLRGGKTAEDPFLAKMRGKADPFAGAKAKSGLGWSGRLGAQMSFAGAEAKGQAAPDISAIEGFDVGFNESPAIDTDEARARRFAEASRGAAIREELAALPITDPRHPWNSEERGLPANLVVGAGTTLEDMGRRLYHGVVDPIAGRVEEREAENPEMIRRAAVRKFAAEHPSAGPSMLPPEPSGVLDEFGKDIKALGHSAMGAGVALGAPWFPALQIADEESGVNALPAWTKMTEEAAPKLVPRSMPGSIASNLIPEAVPKAAESVIQFGAELAPFVAAGGLVHGLKPPLAAGAARGAAALRSELAARAALRNPDAGLLAAKDPNAYTAPVDPNLANFGALADATYTRGAPVPGMGVRVKPGGMPAPGGALPAPETGLARPVPSGHYGGPGVIQGPMRFAEGAPLPGIEPVIPRELPAPTGAVPQGLPDPMEFGRNPGVIVQPTMTPAEAAQAAEVARLRGIQIPPGLFPSIEPPAPVPPRGPSFQEAQAARRSTPGPLPKAPEPVAPTATAPAAPPLAETVRIPHEAGAPVVETLPGAPLPPRFGAAQKPPAPPAPAPTTPIKPVEGVDTARFGAKGPKSEGTSVRPNTQVTLLPKEGTSVPFPEETRIRTQGGAAAEAGRTGRVVIRQADGLEAIVPPERAAEAQRLANEGKLAEIANGEGTSPKPAAPTEIVRAPGRDILVDTPEKRAAAVAANPRATVEPATPENLQKALAERQPAATGGEARQPAAAGETEMPGEPAKSETPPAPEMPVVAAEAPASPPSTSGTSTGRVERLRRDYADIKPGEEFDPFGTEGDRGRSTGYEVGARIVDEGGGKFAAEGAIGYGDDPFRLIGKGTLDEAKAHIARWADEQLRELEGQEAGAPKPVEAEVTNTAPKALPKPAEAPPSPSAFERRMQRGPQPRSSLDEANPTGDLGVDVPTMRASKLWDDPSYAPYGRDPKAGKRLPSDPHALDEAAWRAANEPEFAEPRFGERDPYPEATKASEQAPAAPSAPDVPAAPPVAGSQEGGGAAAEQVLASAHRKMPPEWQGDPYEPDPIAQSILSANDRDTVLREIPPGSRYVDGGHEAIALETPDGKILRIGPARSEPRPNIPEMLQPESTKKVGVGGRWQIETLERADTKDITDADVQAMDDQLRTHGYELSDPGPDNLGRTTDGRLVVLDPGAVTKYEPGPSVPDVRAPAHSGRFGAKRPRATGEPGSVGTWPFAKMRVEPEAMQFKTDLTNVKTGETGALAHVQEPGDWRQAGEGVITLWRDPAHPELDPIVVDGHQRTAAGKRAGAPDPVVRFSEAKTADEAYVEGALLNMRGGTLTPGDAAMFFRRVGKKGDALRAYMKQELIPPKNVNVRRGQALANLSDDLWNAYRQKQLPEDKAVAIGMEDLTPAQQRRVAESDVSAEEVPEKANRVRNAPVVTKQSAGLFGAEVDMASLDDAATKIEKALKTAVKSEKGLYGSAASNATKLEKVGHIETDAAKQASAEAGTFHGVLEKLLGRTGPVNDAVMRAAAEVESGKMTTADAVRSLRAELPGVIRAAHPELADSLPPPSAPPAPKTPTLFRQEDTGAPKAPGTKKPFGRGESGSVGEVPPGGEPPPLGEMAKRTGKAIVEGYKTAGKALDFLDQRILGRGVTAVTKGGWGLAEKIPGVGRLFKGVKAVGEAITKPEGEHLGIDWADRRQRYTRDARLIQHDGAMLVSDFRKALKGTTPQERADVNAYMRSESETLPEGLSEKARRAIDDASNYVNILRDQEVELGTLSPEARTEYARYILRQFESKKPGIFGRRGGIASTERYDLARDAYGVRVKMSLDEVNALLGDTETTYRKQFGSAHDPETVVKFGRDEVAAAEREAFIEEVRQKYAGARSKLTADSTREIKAADVGQAKMLHKAQLDVPRLHDVVVEKFDPMSPEVEAQLKRVVEPGENLAATIMRSSNRIASARFLQRLAEDMDTAKTPDGRQIVVEPTVSETTGRKSVPAGYTILGDERWGPLQGKGVLTDHVEDLRGVLSIRDADGLGARLYDVLRMFNSGWKLTHTVLSPRTIFRQYPSNLEFLNNGGMHWAAPTFPFKVKRGMEIMADPRHPLHREAVANDLLGSTVLAKEELGVGTKFTPGQRVARAIGSGGLSELPDSVLNKASERYAHPDNVSKMTLYAEYRLDLGMSEEAAVREVRKWMPDPRNVSKAVRIASDMPFVSPFARFGVQSKTIGARAWRGRPIRAFTTALQKNIIRASIVALAAQLLGRKDVTPEQEDQLAGERGPLEMPLWQDENGNAISTDYRFLSTTGDVWPRVGKIGESGLWQYLGDFTGVSEAPVIDLVRTVIEGTDRYGRPLTHDRSATGKAMAAVEAYFRQVHPTWSPATGYHADAIEAAFDGKPAYEGAPVQTPAQAIISAIFGINMRPQEAHLELQKLVKQFDSAAGHAETDLINEPIDEGKEPDAEGYGERIQDLAKEFETRAGRFGAKKKPVEAGK